MRILKTPYWKQPLRTFQIRICTDAGGYWSEYCYIPVTRTVQWNPTLTGLGVTNQDVNPRSKVLEEFISRYLAEAATSKGHQASWKERKFSVSKGKPSGTFEMGEAMKNMFLSFFWDINKLCSTIDLHELVIQEVSASGITYFINRRLEKTYSQGMTL